MKPLSKEEIIHSVLTRQHATSRHCDEIDAICQPLFDLIPVNYFNYSRAYWLPGVPSFSLCNRFDVIEHYFKIEGYRYNADAGPMVFPGLHFLDNYIKPVDGSTHPRSVHRLLQKLNEDLSISHLVMITFICAGYLEQCTFGFPVETKDTYRLVLNNKPSLKKFIIYFKDRARHLIKDAKQNKIKINTLCGDFIDTLSFDNLKSLQVANTENFKEVVKPQRYYLDGRFDDVYLTPREAQYLFLLQSYSGYQQIANMLGLSYATVREHIDATKFKLGCANKAELLNAIKTTNLLQFIDDNILLATMHDNLAEVKPEGYELVDRAIEIFNKENGG